MENETLTPDAPAQTETQTAPISDLNVWATPTTQPKVETPVQEAKTEVKTETTEVKTQPEIKPEPLVTEKVVEKIVEKQPEFKDEYSKQLYESLLAGKDTEVYEYLTKKNKNYELMSDSDVVREHLKSANPKWSDKDVDLEIKSKYGTLPEKKDLSEINKELDPEAYEKAEEFNNRIEEKEILLSRDARDARIALEETKKTIEFPKIEQAEQPKQLTQDEIDELNQKWEAHVDTEMPKLSDFKFKVGDEEITYKITDEDKATQTAYMKSFDPQQLVKDLGWMDDQGNENVLKIAEDVLKLKNLDKIIASSATQMKTTATKDALAEIKNIDLNTNSTTASEISLTADDLGAKLWGR